MSVLLQTALVSSSIALLVAGLAVVCHLLRDRVRNADVMRNVLLLAAVVIAVVSYCGGGERMHGEPAGRHDISSDPAGHGSDLDHRPASGPHHHP